MKINELIDVLQAKVLTPNINNDIDIKYAFSGDLMSDALMMLRTAPEDFCEQGVLITGNATMQSVRTAEILDFKMIILTRGKIATEQVIEQAYTSEISILTTENVSFTTNGKLYSHGIKGISDLK